MPSQHVHGLPFQKVRLSNRLQAMLLLILCSSAAQAVQPLTEEDMQNVSAESQSLEQILNLAGDTAAGEVVAELQQNAPGNTIHNSQDHANTDSNRIQNDTESSEKNALLGNTSVSVAFNDVDNTSQTSSSASEFGDSTVTIDPRLKFSDVSATGSNGLAINQSAIVQRVQILNAADANQQIRGNFYYTNIQSQSSMTIQGR
ncbi:hypothetical protein OLMES_1511 [Oleiphilus messinensis]|uniref:Uncharacterized protein n=1 Tax=Oleiphilus messinensis TaxID=141451 RepID=A0A1Y0I731_9GAMM|nr:hypothetical protein [Oleiphilus messinensis]ARU55586.1 hypothetical protein OLMES_1511 [Oleiphilus messinensis]